MCALCFSKNGFNWFLRAQDTNSELDMLREVEGLDGPDDILPF